MEEETFENLGSLYSTPIPKVLSIHLELLEYPILSEKIRERMRDKLFSRAIIKVHDFEEEVKKKAKKSQLKERIDEGVTEESSDVWLQRMGKIRDILTEFYFALNFEHTEFRNIVQEILSEKRPGRHPLFLAFNPEIAPWGLLFKQGDFIEFLPEKEREQVSHHLREIIVVLTKGMLSDQLSFVGIAKNSLSIKDMKWIYERRIGKGKIGGKAGGMMLAKSILHSADPDDPVDFSEVVDIPDSFFLGSDVIYEFVLENGLQDTIQHKYKPFEEISEQYPETFKKFLNAKIPDGYRNLLRKIIQEVGNSPLIVRSSSLLEDNFGIAFAGKYDSYFCPNQGEEEENLVDLCEAIKKVYASVVSPDALAYRQQKGLIDYDERMAILIQKVEGTTFGKYFFPGIAGVGFSHNPFVWNERILRKKGFLRIVTGLGTRAVDRLGNDYAKMVALSHPTIQPVKSNQEKIQYSQRFIDVINIEENKMETLPVKDVLNWNYPYLKLIASISQHGELHPILIAGPGTTKGEIVITLDGLLRNRRFILIMTAILGKLGKYYKRPVDIEFTVEKIQGPPEDFKIHILQCRQQSERAEEHACVLPEDIDPQDIVLVSTRMVTTGCVENIRYVLYVDPEKYNDISSNDLKIKLARTIGKLNTILENEIFILVGPGRWGSSNLQSGVPVSYADIFNARALVEVAIPYGDVAPEASYGTHFFQDLVESNIYPLPIYPDEKDAEFKYDFFRSQVNCLNDFIPKEKDLGEFLSVIDIEKASKGRILEITMNSQDRKAMGYLRDKINP